LRTVRDPFHVAEILRRAGLPFLAVRRMDNPPEPDGRWLLKPHRGGGGRGVRVWDACAKPQAVSFDHSPLTGTDRRLVHHSPLTYFQEYAAGTPVAAVFLASRLSCRLVGVTRQLVGEEELHAPPFAYCGSLGPLRLPGELTGQFERVGRVLAAECDLRGLFGVDCVLREGTVLLVEVNPRYTASVEVLELATGRPLLRWHCRACQSYDDRDAAVAVEAELSREWDAADRHDETLIVGKAIPYAAASREVTAPSLDGVLPPVEWAGGTIPAIADIPQPGSTIPPGGPICTVFAAAGTVAECLNALFDRVWALSRSLTPNVRVAAD
jgi:predicted ATP-grasp superfamily ATP-dependent carboligase